VTSAKPARGLQITGGTPDLKRVSVNIAGVNHSALSVTPQGTAHQVQVVLSPSVSAGQVPLKVSMDGRSSQPYYMPVLR